MHALTNNEGIKYETTHPDVMFNTNLRKVFKHARSELDRLLSGPKGGVIINRFFNGRSVGFSDLHDIRADFKTAPGAVEVNFKAHDTKLMSDIRRVANGA